jgi:hypothetical protein
MLNVAEISGNQYGVGFPVDTPVMLGYFEGSDFVPVEEDYPDYDHLMNHVAVQMDSNDLQLYRTPVVMTLQGELEETEEEDGGEEGEEGEEEELSLDQLIALEDEYEDEYDDEDYDDEDDDELDLDLDEEEDDNGDGSSNEAMSRFMNASPVGKLDPKYNAQPDVTIFRPEGADGSNNDDYLPPLDAIVTAEDTRGLRKAHRRADRIIAHATDIKLIASFHYKKRNFHLVKLLEPLFIVGRRIHDIKGYYFNLLDAKDSAHVTPTLEHLLAARQDDDKRRVERGLSPTTAPLRNDASNDDGSASASGGGMKRANGGANRRSWRDRKKNN